MRKGLSLFLIFCTYELTETVIARIRPTTGSNQMKFPSWRRKVTESLTPNSETVGNLYVPSRNGKISFLQ